MNTAIKRIGIIDSGLGGLTVLKPLLSYYPADYLYVADTVNLPYGTKSTKQIQQLSVRMIDFLLDQKVDACIIACHTICAAALSYLKQLFTPVILLGIDAIVAKQAIDKTKNNRIGIIATNTSIARHTQKKEVLRLKKDCLVFEQACPRIVPAIEYHYDNKKLLRAILQEDLYMMRQNEIDTLILGCTHYTIVSNEIQELMGRTVNLVCANQLIMHDFVKSEIVESTAQIFVTGNPAEFTQKLKYVFDWTVNQVLHVNLNQKRCGSTNYVLVEPS